MIGRDVPESQQAFMRDLAIDVMARTLWGEARGENRIGMEAVACVIMNRVHLAQRRGGMWWGHDVFSVCQKPYQFSCWNKDDPNRPKLLAVTTADPRFRVAMDIARRAVTLGLNDMTMGADHYHTRAVKPKWSKGRTPCALIGQHVFFRLES